jgi:hypothetical protein
VSVSGFSGVCVDEDGNEKRVSPFLLTWEERSEIYVGALVLWTNHSAWS